jgi:hypothetical protein
MYIIFLNFILPKFYPGFKFNINNFVFKFIEKAKIILNIFFHHHHFNFFNEFNFIAFYNNLKYNLPNFINILYFLKYFIYLYHHSFYNFYLDNYFL